VIGSGFHRTLHSGIVNPGSNARDQVVLITGGNTGIGFFTALGLARQGAHVLLACRDARRAQTACERICAASGNRRVEPLELDLGDLNSVARCAQTVLARDLPLHVLINNAGIAGARGLSVSGYEIAFGINHIGHFALTQWLLPRMRASAPARIVTVASRAHHMARGIPFADLQRRTHSWLTVQEYAVSKLANILFSHELSRRLGGTGIQTYSLHPGVVATEIWRHAPKFLVALRKRSMIDAEQGAETSLFCASSPEVQGQSGLYYDACKPREPSALAQDRALAAQLWEFSERAIQSFNPHG